MDTILTEGQRGESWISEALANGQKEALIPGGELNISQDAHIPSGKSIHIKGGTIMLNYGSSIIVEDKAELELSDLTVIGDGSGSLIEVKGGTLRLKEGSALSGGTSNSEYQGGAVTVTGNGELSLEGGGIYSSIAVRGGGVLVDDGCMMVSSGEVTGCSASFGGGIYVSEKGVLKLGSDGSNGSVGTMFFANKADELGSYKIHGNAASQDGSDIYAISQKAPIAAAPEESYATVVFYSQGGNQISPIKVPVGIGVQLPRPQKPGYAFGGWHSDEPCLMPLDEVETIKGDMAVYAKWSTSTLLITFLTLGGSTVPPRRIYYGERLAMPENPVLPGYSFTGWSKDENGSEPFDWMAPITNNLTLYANWKSETVPSQAQLESTIIIADFEEISPEEDLQKPYTEDKAIIYQAIEEAPAVEMPQAAELELSQAIEMAEPAQSASNAIEAVPIAPRQANRKQGSQSQRGASKQPSRNRQQAQQPQARPRQNSQRGHGQATYQSPVSPEMYSFVVGRQRSSPKK